jgi:CRP/FNR family transcriptional regulator, cyclic AMP receptor protein
MSKFQSEEIFQFLKKVTLFENVTTDDLRKVVDVLILKKCQKGEDIIHEGDKGNSIYFLLEGQVNINKKMTLISRSDEKSQMDKVLIKLKDSDHPFFGEMAICTEGEVRSATVTAETDCLVGELSAENVHKMVNQHPIFGLRFYQNLSGVLADRLRKANYDILKLTTALTLALEE